MASLRFQVQPPARVRADQVLVPVVEVGVLDAQGAPVASAVSVTLALGAVPTPGSALAGQTLQSSAGGVARFAGVSVDHVGQGFTLTASAPGYASATSAAFDVTANQLAFLVQPRDVASSDLIEVSVVARDRFGTRDTTFTEPVELSPRNHPLGSVLVGTTRVNAVQGVASFGASQGVSSEVTGSYQLLAQSSPLDFAVSSTFMIGPRPLPPRVLTFSAAPSPAGDGESVTLSWTTSGPATLTLEPGGDVTGTSSAAVTPFPGGSSPLPVGYRLCATTAAIQTEVGTLTWARAAGSFRSDRATDLVVLADGGCLVTGYFRETITFDQGGPGQTTLMSANPLEDDVFLARYAANGGLVWARRAGGAGRDQSAGIALLPGGDAVVVGWFNANSTFGPGEPAQTTLITSQPQGFLARYDANGALVWAKACGGTVSGESGGVAVLAGGDVVVAGFFRGTVTLGAGEPGARTLTAGFGGADAFVARYAASDGSLVWAAQVTGGDTYGEVITALPDGELVVGGRFESQAILGQAPASITLTSPHGRAQLQVWLARYRADGAFVWARQVSAQDGVQALDLATTLQGQVLMSGQFAHSATFGAGEPGETTLAGTGATLDGFLARFEPDGRLAWAAGFGGPEICRGNAVTALPDGGAAVTGEFDDELTFAPGTARQRYLPAAGPQGGFLARFGPAGTFEWATPFLNSGSFAGRAVGGLPHGGVFVAGSFGVSYGTIGAGDPGQVTLDVVGSDDVFIARFDPVNCRFLAVEHR